MSTLFYFCCNIDFVLHSFRKLSEKLGMAQQTANAAATTGALSTAVDRMSFAHDIVMMTDEAIAIGLVRDKKITKQNKTKQKVIKIDYYQTAIGPTIQRSIARIDFDDRRQFNQSG